MTIDASADFAVYELASMRVLRRENHPAGAVPEPGTDFGYLAISKDIMLQSGDRVIDGALVGYVPTQADALAVKQGAAIAVYEAKIAAGFTYAGDLYQIDMQSQSQITAMAAMALGSLTDPDHSPWPEGFYWVAADNSHVAMDATATYAFGRAVAGYVSACILNLRSIKDRIAAAPDQAALVAIDVTAGYPPANG